MSSSRHPSSSSRPTKISTSAPTKKPIPTHANPLGDMQRTVIEGLVPKTSRPTTRPPTSSRLIAMISNRPLERVASQHGSPSSVKPSSVKPPSSIRPPPSTKPSTQISKPSGTTTRETDHSTGPNSSHPSVLKTQHDITMASRQTSINTLSPAKKAQQETWARGQLKMHDKTCPANLEWTRTSKGYRCKGRAHVVSDELLAEGRGGMWYDFAPVGLPEEWIGPLYGEDIADAYYRRGRFRDGRFGSAGFMRHPRLRSNALER